MTDELKELREEIGRLRERIAVLEDRPIYYPPARVVGPASPGHGDPYPPSPYRLVPMTVPDTNPRYYVGDAPGWWLHGPTA